MSRVIAETEQALRAALMPPPGSRNPGLPVPPLYSLIAAYAVSLPNVMTVAGSSESGYLDSGVGGALKARLHRPYGVCRYKPLPKTSPAATTTATAGSSGGDSKLPPVAAGSGEAESPDLDMGDSLLFADIDSHTIRRYHIQSDRISTFAGTGIGANKTSSDSRVTTTDAGVHRLKCTFDSLLNVMLDPNNRAGGMNRCFIATTNTIYECDLNTDLVTPLTFASGKLGDPNTLYNIYGMLIARTSTDTDGSESGKSSADVKQLSRPPKPTAGPKHAGRRRGDTLWVMDSVNARIVTTEVTAKYTTLAFQRDGSNPLFAVWDVNTPTPDTCFYYASGGSVYRFDTTTLQDKPVNYKLPDGAATANLIGLDMTRSGILLASCYHRHAVFAINPDTGATRQLTGGDTSGSGTSGYRDGDCGTAQFSNPCCLVLSVNEECVWITDQLNHRIRRLQLSYPLIDS